MRELVFQYCLALVTIRLFFNPNNPSDRETFFNNLWRYVDRTGDHILTSDFNCVPNLRLDKWGGDDSLGDRGIPQLHAIVDCLALKDVFRAKQPAAREFT